MKDSQSGDPFFEGQEAYLNDEADWMNPYVFPSREYELWNDGYYIARAEVEERMKARQKSP